jgi:hypothetical protein
MVKRGSSQALSRVRSKMFSRGGLPDLLEITPKQEITDARAKTDLLAVKESVSTCRRMSLISLLSKKQYSLVMVPSLCDDCTDMA